MVSPDFSMVASSHVTDTTGVDRVRERIDLVAPDIDWNEAAARFGFSVSNRTQRIASGLESQTHAQALDFRHLAPNFDPTYTKRTSGWPTWPEMHAGADP